MSTSSSTTSDLPEMETILLVENDEAVLRVVELMLKRIGYKVLCANNGVAALQIASQGNVKIDLLLTDILMKPLSGVETANCILTICPRIKVMFISTDTSRSGIAGYYPLLQKPFTPNQLAEKLRAVLDSSRHGL